MLWHLKNSLEQDGPSLKNKTFTLYFSCINLPINDSLNFDINHNVFANKIISSFLLELTFLNIFNNNNSI